MKNKHNLLCRCNTCKLRRKSNSIYISSILINLIIIAQRIGTIINADKIIVLDKGKTVGVGTHKQLLKKCKVYKEIALSQLTKEELENE